MRPLSFRANREPVLSRGRRKGPEPAVQGAAGELPLTGDVPEHHNAVGSTPGVGVMQVMENGASGTFTNLAPMTNVVDGVETADAHAIAVRQL